MLRRVSPSEGIQQKFPEWVVLVTTRDKNPLVDHLFSSSGSTHSPLILFTARHIAPSARG